MIFKKILASLTVAAALGTATVPAAFAGAVIFEHGPNLVTNGGFETGDFTGWIAVTDGFSGVDGPSARSGSWGAYLGNADTLGTLTQTLATTAGENYNIHFWLASDGLTPNEFRVQWGGVTVFDSSNMGIFDYTEFVIDPMATSALTTLELGFRNDLGFLALDDVSVVQVPEPFSLALLGIGLFGMGWLRRKAA